MRLIISTGNLSILISKVEVAIKASGTLVGKNNLL